MIDYDNDATPVMNVGTQLGPDDRIIFTIGFCYREKITTRLYRWLRRR